MPRPRVVTERVGVQNRKFLIELVDGSQIEAVLYRGDSVCLSTQVGCAVACPFCASGAQGLRRPLRLDELQSQVHLLENAGHSIARATMSGIGEPLHNPHCIDFLEWAQKRRLPLSLTTSGGPLPRLQRWLSLPHNGLTISVHAGTETVRAQMVPNAPSLDELFVILRRQLPHLNGRRKKKLALAYLLIAGRNDSNAELDAFASRALPLGLRVHLYQMNQVDHWPGAPVPRAVYEAAYERLKATGLVVSMSSQARIEALGGCGTLVPITRALSRRPFG